MYAFDSRIRYSEVGEDKKITLNAILNYFQDCSTFHSEDLGVGVDFLEKHGQAWVLNAWQLVVERYADLCEEVTVATWPYDFGGLMGLRNFTMRSRSGELLAYANTIWAYLDVRRGRPVRIPAEMEKLYGVEEKFPMDYAPRKIPVPEDAVPGEAFPVHSSHLDTNHHVNNGQYVLMAQEYLPEGFAVRQMRAEYKRSAVLGDMIWPKVKQEENRCTVALCDAQGKPYATVEFLRRDGKT